MADADVQFVSRSGSQTVIKVGEKVYYFDKDSNKKYHKDICKEAKDGTVTGTVKKDGDKMVITATKVEFK